MPLEKVNLLGARFRKIAEKGRKRRMRKTMTKPDLTPAILTALQLHIITVLHEENRPCSAQVKNHPSMYPKATSMMVWPLFKFLFEKEVRG